ncbi:MAG TPA: hypothetical protein VGW38_02420, partial [Chloroflexota bacterium]|nr:hypothetical protein [Chloroflexota bacterium]
AQLAPAAVAALRLVPDVGVQCTEASLGDVPPWLAGFVPQVGADNTAAEARSWVSRRLSLRRQPAWLYRRLVFEPVPYDAAPGNSRQVLDAALSAALEAISSHEQDT